MSSAFVGALREAFRANDLSPEMRQFIKHYIPKWRDRMQDIPVTEVRRSERLLRDCSLDENPIFVLIPTDFSQFDPVEHVFQSASLGPLSLAGEAFHALGELSRQGKEITAVHVVTIGVLEHLRARFTVRS